MGNRAIELLELMAQVLGLGDAEKEESSTPTPTHNKDSRGKNQPVGDYPDSPLRYRGGGR